MPARVTLTPDGLELSQPMTLYHATVQADKVFKSGGLKTRSELEGLNMTGGGTSKAVSMTGDARVAAAIVTGLVTICGLVRGEISIRKVIQAFRVKCPKAFKAMEENGDVKEIESVYHMAPLYEEGLWRVKGDYFTKKKPTGRYETEWRRGEGFKIPLEDYRAYHEEHSPWVGRLKAEDYFVDAYKKMLFYGSFYKEVYDPLFMSTDLRFFDVPCSELIENICILEAELSRSAVIVPRDRGDFSSLFPASTLRYIEFPVVESNLEWDVRSPKDAWRFVNAGTYNPPNSSYADLEIVVPEYESRVKITPPFKANVSYLFAMDEYRIFDTKLLSKYKVLSCGEEVLKTAEEILGTPYFWAYFEMNTLAEDLAASQWV